MNFVFISPNFPTIYSHFIKSLAERGVHVFGIGDTPKENINQELKDNLVEYCFVSDLGNIQWMKNTLDYLANKYGPIDYIESNNEYWLMNDAIYREYKNVTNGFYPKDMDKIKFKSKMKQYFANAGVKTARYCMATDYEAVKTFASEVGYPLFSKPDNGVGASSSHKINNDEQLKRFFETKKDIPYIIEEFIDGTIITFDGIADDNSEPILMFNEVFLVPVADVVNDDIDDYYYASLDMDEDFRKMGKKVVESFGIKKRCFHIEFFKMNCDKPGFAKKNEIIGLEVNMRSPGGDTPDLLSIAMNGSYYDAYADTIVFNKLNTSINNTHEIAISVSKKNRFQYIHNHEQIEDKYKENIIRHGLYPKEIADAMGDEFYFAKFKSVNDALNFKDFVMQKL